MINYCGLFLFQNTYLNFFIGSYVWTAHFEQPHLLTHYLILATVFNIKYDLFLFLIIVFTFLKVYNSTEIRPERQSCTSTKTEQGYWGQASCHKSLHVWQDPVTSRLHSLNLSEICVPLSSTLRFISGLSSSSSFVICIRIRIRILYSSVFRVLNSVFFPIF